MKREETILNLYKKIGETPLECIVRFKKSYPEYADMKMTYAGRLDPMAEGVLVVLAGNTSDVLKKEILDMDKEYQFEVLWGFETDTYDALGMVLKKEAVPVIHFDKKIPSLLEFALDRKVQTYPPYSSKTVLGKPLFAIAREGKIDEIEVPSRGIRIFSIDHIHTRLLSVDKIFSEISERIQKIQGDFRQKDILDSWENYFDSEGQVLVSLFRTTVSSGTYIRSLAHEFGKKIGSGALAYSIKRTRVGKYRIEDSIKI